MNKFAAGLAAGLVATLALSALMLMKAAMGLMPQLDVIALLGDTLGVGVGGAWAAHFMIGLIWGVVFAGIAPKLPGGPCWGRGVVFGLGAWLLMMVIVMPMAGAGFFAMNLGIMALVMTAVLHMIFGAVLGLTYGRLAKSEEVDWEGRPHRA